MGTIPLRKREQRERRTPAFRQLSVSVRNPSFPFLLLCVVWSVGDSFLQIHIPAVGFPPSRRGSCFHPPVAWPPLEGTPCEVGFFPVLAAPRQGEGSGTRASLGLVDIV